MHCIAVDLEKYNSLGIFGFLSLVSTPGNIRIPFSGFYPWEYSDSFLWFLQGFDPSMLSRPTIDEDLSARQNEWRFVSMFYE